MRKQPGKRLADTADFIISVSSPGKLEDDAEGYFQINKTRLIHGIARFHLLQGENWNINWGHPINQEDMAGTNLAFSFIILRGLKKAGYILTEKEKESFIGLWRYIGFHLNITTDLLPANYEEAIILERSIRTRNFKKSVEGMELAHELISYFKTMLPEKESNFIEAQIRYWLGKTVSNCLGLDENSAKDNQILALNFWQESTNFLKLKPNDYETMIRNHAKIKSLLTSN
jgi:hypothetical protein